jgi:hypothetical protein
MCFKESIAYFGTKNNQAVGKGEVPHSNDSVKAAFLASISCLELPD